MGVDQDRQATAQARRRAVIAALNDGFNLEDRNSHVSRFRELVQIGEPRYIVGNADIDGLLSAQMLHAVTGWQIAALIDKTSVRVHPSVGSLGDLLRDHKVFGVDIFSPLFPGVSNHPVLFGRSTSGRLDLRAELDAFDEGVHEAVAEHHHLNLSAWVGIGARFGSTSPLGLPYKYPLGTAQLLLAVLEAAQLPIRLYDRQYLPWLIANCDGGVDTIRTYSWNAETWWSAMAAVVGPASHSEALYRMVTNQRPNEFLDMDRRLRYEDPERARFLTGKWNIAGSSREALSAVSTLITDLSGWPDPFLGGVGNLDDWLPRTPTRSALPLVGITRLDPRVRAAHLAAAGRAAHMNFSVFKERGTALGWWLPETDAAVEQAIGGSETVVEEIDEDQPSVPDLDIG